MSYFDEEKYENNEENKDNTEGVTPSADTEAHGVAYSPAEDGSYRLTSYVPTEEVAAPKKKGGKGKIALAIVAIVLCVALSGFAGFAGTYIADRFFTIIDSGKPAPNTPPVSSGSSAGIVVSVPDENGEKTPVSVPRGELMNYADAAATVKDSVVEITTEATVGGGYFQQYVTEGAGSGVIITAEGYIVTNNHVIEDAEKITVRLTDGTQYPATLIGTDSRTDIAVIKIDPKDRALSVAAFIADSKKLVVGTEVLAIGNPLGELGGTVTNGIISALERELKISGSGTMTLLQTNAAVNPGNSGGGLFNLYGELVGVVNAKSAGNNIEGLGFAIPANTVRTIVAQLMEFGYVKGRPTIAVTVLGLDAYSAYYYFRSSQAGVYIVESNEEALKYGDRILAIGGTAITDAEDVSAIIEKHEIGESIEIMVVRDRKTITVSVTLSEYVPAPSK